MNRAIVTYAAGAHEELLDISLPRYKEFAQKHNYDMIVGEKMTDRPPAWNKVPLLLDALSCYECVVWFDCDLVVVDTSEDFPPVPVGKLHSLVRHLEEHSEVPNSGVWIVTPDIVPLLHDMSELDVFTNHGWWEQAALMTLMGYTVPPEGSDFSKTKCRVVHATHWHRACQFMRLPWNSHPNYRAEQPRIVHCSYPDMSERVEVMRKLLVDPDYAYPRYSKREKE